MRWSKVSNWPDYILVPVGFAAAYIEVPLVFASVFVGIAEPFQTYEHFLAEFWADLSRFLIGDAWFALVAALPFIVSIVLALAKHKKPWRAPSQMAIGALLPLVIWSACNVVSAPSDGGIGVHVPPPAWIHWPVFSAIGNFYVLLGILSFAAASCLRQWLRENGNDVSLDAMKQGLAKAYHGE